MKKEVIKTVLFLGMVFLLVGTVSAFAVSSKYWEENPLKINPGETKEAFVILQNLAGDSDLVVQGFNTSTNEGVEIYFTDSSDIYEVPLGSKVQANFSVTVPAGVQIGDLYYVTVSFKTLEKTDSGEFGFGSGIEREIPLLISQHEKSSSSNYWWIYLIVAIIVVGLALLFVFKRRKKSQ